MRLVPEWNDHSKCLIAWPCNHDLYGNQIHEARIEIANLANQISEEEEVFIYCNDIDYKSCIKIVSNKNISILKTNLDDSWMRDIAPIFFRNGNDLNAVSFNFNGYGKYPNFKNDNQISKFICNQFNIEFIEADLTLEGGAITYDDHGNLFTTESVLLNSNRKNASKNDINKTLMDLFDLKNIVWLPGGLEEDDTDGHIDNIFAPIGDNKYLIACSDLDDRRNYSILQKNKEILEQFFLLKNINAEIIQIPLPSEIIVENKRLVASYINFYFSKNSIFLPKFNVKEDELVYDIFKSLYKDKNIKMIETKNINYGCGNIHCVTMNVPKI